MSAKANILAKLKKSLEGIRAWPCTKPRAS